MLSGGSLQTRERGAIVVASGLSSADAAIDAAGAGIWNWELAQRRVTLSHGAARLLGTDALVISHDDLVAMVHSHDSREMEKALQDHLYANRLLDLDFRIANGQWRRICGRAGPGKETACGLLVDVGLRRSMQTTDSRLAAIVSSSDDAIIGKTVDGIVMNWNRGAESIFGYAADEMIGQPINRLLPPDLMDEEDRILERIRRGEKVDHFETRRQRKDGVIINVSATISPVYDGDGKLIGASKVARDITSTKRSQQQLQTLQAELIFISRYSALGEMASTLAHELNQPLMAISSYLSGARLYLDRGHAEDALIVRQAIEDAENQALRAGEIIKRLREFFAKGEGDRHAEDLQKLVEEASALALVGAKEIGVNVSFSFSSPQSVMVDKVQIQQVILNLVRNALEALQTVQRRELKIITRIVDAQTMEVAVIDTGPGIAPEVAAKLFQPFVTTKRHGMGVGLSISRTIIEAHGGKLWAESNPKGGTIFHLTLKTAHSDQLYDA
jgi:two-component system sensor kinase FixL